VEIQIDRPAMSGTTVKTRKLTLNMTELKTMSDLDQGIEKGEGPEWGCDCNG